MFESCVTVTTGFDFGDRGFDEKQIFIGAFSEQITDFDPCIKIFVV